MNQDRAGVALSGAHGLMAELQRHGISCVFGVPGHGAYPLYNALIDFPEIQPIVGRNEQGIGFAANGYAWASNSTAVLTSVPGAGFTNSLTALLEADRAQTRVLYVVEKHQLHSPLVDLVGRYHRDVDSPDEVGEAAADLLDQLTRGRPGVAVLEATPEALSGRPRQAEPRDVSTQAAVIPVNSIAEAADFLRTARRVVIYAGASAGSPEASEHVLRLAERLDAPVFVDSFARGVIPEDHRLALGHSWTLNGPGERLMASADVVIVIGAPVITFDNTKIWDYRSVAGKRPAEVLARQLLLIDWDDEDHSSLPARLRLHGSVPEILSALASQVQPVSRSEISQDELETIRQFGWDDVRERCPHATGFFREMCSYLNRDALLFGDSSIGIWMDFLLRINRPRGFRYPLGTATLGFALPAAIGAAMADRNREVVAFMGDGAFLYNAQELATIARHEVDLTIIVANDHAYSAITHTMKDLYNRTSDAARLVNPDLALAAKSHGIASQQLSAPEELWEAMDDARHRPGATLIEVPLSLDYPRALYDL